ncbi:MAG: preprotein translocase subunit SecA [Clostridiales bacterium]|nr:preprotein translocase subunit SecA [Clostridiales bacterium]
MGLFGFGDNTKSQLKKLEKIAAKIEALDNEMQSLSDEQLKEKTQEFKDRYSKNETLDDLLPEAFAVIREAAWRVLGQKPFHVQLIGGIVLHQGRIAEMKTGEGKTLTATLPAYLNAISGKGVHIVTVNEYLAGYQSEMMSKLFNFLGLSVGNIYNMMAHEDRVAAYNSDITYGTNSEFGFDYLRDNMAKNQAQRSQRELNFAIVDEVDSILIDEARTPLIISGAGQESSEMYVLAHKAVKGFSGIQEKEKASKLDLPDEEYEKERLKHDFTLDEKAKTVALTETGVKKVEKTLGIQDLSDPENTEIAHHVNQALKANFIFKRDRDYVVSDGQVKIVDEFTGRILEGRRYSEGLHQAIEAKENVKIERENQTLATITYQNFFRMYKKLSGMTGTAKTEEEEFKGIYALDVVCVPTNKPMIRQDLNDRIYSGIKEKFNAVVDEVVQRHQTGQPVLVGTVSVEVSEYVSALLRKRGVKHEVLNAKHHKKEAEIVAQAGRLGAVTIATNMAGRGTDILLGGNPDFMARKDLLGQGYEDYKIDLATGHQKTDDQEILDLREKYKELLLKYKALTDAEHIKVVEAGGLCIIGTERHESRRIDNQLRGRAGRQGDPGASCFFISFEDDLMRIFGGDRIQGLASKALEGNMALEAGMLSKTIENAQKRVESRNFSIRKNVLQYDDVMNTQRETIYSQRRRVLEGEDVSLSLEEMKNRVIERLVQAFTADQDKDEWNLKGMTEELKRLCISNDVKASVFKDLSRKEIIEKAKELSIEKYEKRAEDFKKAGYDIKDLERLALLESVDMHWMDHIDQMDQLRQGISLRSMAQRDPLQEYTIEGFDMFEEMNRLIQEDAVRFAFNATLNIRVNNPKVTGESTNGNQPQRPKKAGAVQTQKIGRNDPCPCGSGKKYKNCCGK